MKHLIPVFYTLICLTLFACKSDPKPTDPPEEPVDPQVETPVEQASVSPTDNIAICLWNEAGLRDKPGRGKNIKYLETIKFGEVVTLTGNSETLEKEDRTYLEIELSDGKKGWSNAYLFAEQAERAAALKTMEIYKRPELTTITGKTFEQGDIFAVKVSDREGWVEVFGREKKKAGWARVTEGSYSVDEVDVTVAILLSRAKSESDPKKREETLNMIASNGTFAASPLMSVVDAQLAEIQAIPELPANQLYITAENLNVRSEPDNEADNVVFQVGNGTICNILERGERVPIREMNDYWYKIETDGQEGWVYGFFTSKRLE
ncbi:MAG: SH3 domain-containing protein [Bacteroidota bacterium]